MVNKGFVYMAFRKFFLWGTYSGVVLNGQDSAMFPAWVANCTAGFGSSCRLMELCRYKAQLELTVTGYQGKMPNIYKAHLCGIVRLFGSPIMSVCVLCLCTRWKQD